MSSKSSEHQNPTSYTSMAATVGDVEAIGKHCQAAFCNQLDFLPFRCESCKGTFCLEHRTESAHKCDNAGAWAKRRREAESRSSGYTPTQKPTVLNHEKQCATPVCKTLIDTPLTPSIHCPNCNRHYCLKHRMREDHDCSNLKPLGARPPNMMQQQREKGLAALDKLRLWGASKKDSMASTAQKSGSTIVSKASSGSARSAAASVAAINQLKRTAVGDASIAQDKRIYLYVDATANTAEKKTGNFFYNKERTVGHLLDKAAKDLKIPNLNNSGKEEDKLSVCLVMPKGTRVLKFSEKLCESCQNGDTIHLIRGFPSAPNLIEM
ncbi:hypothetical protein EJ05DRAFT_496077 [Pseudovirgaria hyperparasitica]|uniref:AN1-type domain-containing protein n=1 Tax=Pseudovirgaria hyperparasitica TaxID=470096 RepID=A0A6A6WM09_9PEZI|nr:uncharacterized protein EJ05DRAFT_496077 [Pseudovirgaria hyperparasitica]KAF2763247.1 hypothetical protein EJ05DRAFT_496077 [Pseudovirgaria hyperparasitica]